MYINNAYLNDSLLNYKDTKNKLSIISCGNYRLVKKKKLPTFRPHGRLDYQLIYIHSGIAHFYLESDKDATIVSAGSFVLFRPKEFQKYVYYSSEAPEVFWVHFSGTDVKNLLRGVGISDDIRVIKGDSKTIYVELFNSIISEIQNKDISFVQMINSYFTQLLILIARNNNAGSDKNLSFIKREIQTAKDYFSNHYNEDLSVDTYAASRGMSISWFIRKFREFTGVTPLQFILEQRISNAQLLLESTDYSINEISNLVGYDNQLYFSRLFRKQKGVSPRKYRELIKT